MDMLEWGVLTAVGAGAVAMVVNAWRKHRRQVRRIEEAKKRAQEHRERWERMMEERNWPEPPPGVHRRHRIGEDHG